MKGQFPYRVTRPASAHAVIAGLLFTSQFALQSATLAADDIEMASQVSPDSEYMDTSVLREYQTMTPWGEQRLVKGEIDGRETWNIVNSIYSAPNPLIDHIVLDRSTLEFLGRFAPYFAIGKHYLAATIRDGELSGSLNPLDGGDPIIMNTQLDSKVFEEASLGLVLASLPLEVGYRATVPRLAISASAQSFLQGTIDIHVTNREEITGGDQKSYFCWVVEATWSGVDYHEVHWISDAPPYSIQKKATFPNGRKSESGFVSVNSSE